MFARRIFLLAIGLTVAVSVGVAWWTQRQVLRAAVPAQLERIRNHVRLHAQRIDDAARRAGDDAAAMARAPIVSLVLSGRSDEPPTPAASSAANEVASLLVSQLEAKPWILQFRVIEADEAGLERVRVDRSGPGETIRVVEEAGLQRKGGRPYAVEGRRLPPGVTHLSPLDLNREEGEVSLPLQLVTRAVAPVFRNGERVGMVVVNVDMGIVLERLHSEIYPGSLVHVVNGAGDYLRHPQGEAYEHGSFRGVSADWRQDFRGIESVLAGTGTGLVTRPDGERLGVVVAPTSLSPEVLVVETAPYDQIVQFSATAWRAAAAVAVVALAGALLPVGLLAASVGRPLKRMAQVVGEFGSSGWDLSLLPRNGEFGEVTAAFERMVATVHARESSLEQEVAERRNAEERLRAQVEREREAEERFRLLVESCPSGVCVVDESGVIVLVNRAIEALFGYTREELIGNSVDMLVPDAVRGSHARMRAGYVASPEARPMGAGRDLSGRRKDGSEVGVEIGLVPLTLHGVQTVLASVVDITERRRERARLSDYASRLEASNAELEKFAYVVSHDIKAPLRGISSVATWIAEDFGSVVDDQSRENLDLLLERTRRLGRLIDGILEYSRAGKPEGAVDEIETSALVADVVESVDPPESIRVRLEGAFPRVRYNETQLRQVFQNLLDNAIKHIGRPSGEIVISCEEDEDGWRFRVRDDGVGIPERHFERIFELFQTLRPKDETGTTGAGLAITRRIVESNGGAISVRSSEGEGAEFSFTVRRGTPVARPEPVGKGVES